MKMTKTKNEINVWIFLLLFVPVVCVDDFYKVTKVESCFDAELEPLEWDRQASWICYNDVNLYHCVEDENGSGQMFEFCRDPVNIQPGFYPTYSDDVDRIIPKPCRHGYYQSRSVDSSDISRCKKWSVCDEMGRLLCKEGTTTEDSRCRCDNNAGYTILIYGNSPSNTETCCPESDTTCKCWEKPCQPGQKLNTVYQCVVIPPCGSGFYRPNGSDDCVPIATNGSIPTGDPATQTPTPKTTTTVTQTETTRIVTKAMLKPDDDDITKNALISCCVGLFIAVVIALVVIWFCCPTARAILFCINVKEEEIDEDLEPAKELRCYWPCCYKPRPINRATSRDFIDLENPEEGQNLANNVGLGFTEDTLREKMRTSKRIRRLSSSLMNVGEKPNSPDEDVFRQRSNTGTYGHAVSSPSTPHNYSTLNIQRTSKSPLSRATSNMTNKSIKRTTKLCCGCFGWEEIEPIPDVTNGCTPLTPTEQFSFVDGTPKIGNGTSPAHPDRFMEYAGNTPHVGAIPLIEVTGSKRSIAASDDISVEVFKPDSHEELTSVKEDGYKYEDFPELFNEKVHERIGIVTVCGHQGTGFRVGEDLIMTTYNLFDNNSTGVINTIKRQIITLVDTSQPSLEIEELESKCFKATLEQRHKFSSRTTKIQRLLDVWIQNNSPGFTFTDVAQIFSEIRPNIMQGIMDLVKQNWNAKIQFGFHREGESSPELQYDLASDIPYYSDRYNIIILRLIRKPDIVVPPRFYLSMESDIEVGMYLLGHPDGNILTIDPLCHIYMGDNLRNDIKSDTEKAYKWCENNYKWDSSDNDARTTNFKHLASQYSVLQQGDDMIFNCSRPILHNATGCLGVVINKSWPEMFKIQTMLLTGHPLILQDFAKNFDPKKEKVKLFYEKGLTMKKVYRLLSNAKVIHLRENLFAKFEDVNKDQKNKETEDKKKKKKKPTKHIHKHKHKHIVIVKGEGSNVAVGEHAMIIHQGQVNNEGQGQVSDDKGQSDIEEEEVSDSQINKDSEVSGTNGDTEGNSDSSSSEKSENSFQGFKPSTKNKSETPEQTKVETKIESQLKSATPKTEESKTKESQSTIKSLNDEEHLDKGKEPSSQMNHSGHTESSNDSLERLIETLKEQGMRIRGSVPKDGNCFFHAVVDQLKRLDMSQKTLSHFQLRSQVVWYLKNYPEEQLTDVKDCVEGSWNEYLKKMERDGEYADHVIIQFTAKYLQREILIVTSSPGSKNANRENVIINEEDGRNGCPLLLGHVYENHYESLQMKDEAELEMDCGNASDG